MHPISFKRHRFPPEVIRYAVWLDFRFTLSIRDVEELLAERGIEVSREAIRCWAIKFGPPIAANLRRRRSSPTGRWRLDEMVVKIRGQRMYLWRAVGDEGEVLDMLVQRRRNKKAALNLLRKGTKGSIRSPSRRTSLRRIVRRPGILASPIGTDPAACEPTIGRRTRPCRSAGGGGSSRSSRARAQPRGTSPPTPQFTTHSISKDT